MYEARLAAIAGEIAARNFDWSDHALAALTDPDSNIRRADMIAALTVNDREIIEDYPGDWPRPSCPVLSWIGGRAVHIVVTYPPRPTIVTVYWPDSRPEEWDRTFRRRVGR